MADNCRRFVLQHTMDPVADGLYVGSAMAEGDEPLLREAGITHILSVASHYVASYPTRFTYKLVSIDDLPEENIIQHFPECNRFIGAALAGGGRVLVHCLAGQSRSAAVAAAFLMQRDRLDAEQALKVLKERRPQIHPNAGFIEQLQLYRDLDYDVSTEKALYRRFLIGRSADYFRTHGAVGAVTVAARPAAQGRHAVRCRKCRCPLVDAPNIVDHRAGAGQAEFSFKKRDGSGTSTPHAFPQNHACSSLFVEPMEWMDSVGDGVVEGPIHCPKCRAKLGAYNWAGAQCSCGKWITPSFQIHRSKVDEVRHQLLSPPPPPPLV
ncbi:tyrosine protein phosphatase yvh1 [Coemansia helicoidea]|uniref:Tyrosine protein phosphatase yvh1 n=1 Tax=Coemansia helicoidea TaxID=1286919 RepID=A0ACC1LEN0_9FUNG|nr:tyrosine protein phosphatase yvh1 [Coemansia helicoidea]